MYFYYYTFTMINLRRYIVMWFSLLALGITTSVFAASFIPVMQSIERPVSEERPTKRFQNLAVNEDCFLSKLDHNNDDYVNWEDLQYLYDNVWIQWWECGVWKLCTYRWSQERCTDRYTTNDARNFYIFLRGWSSIETIQQQATHCGDVECVDQCAEYDEAKYDYYDWNEDWDIDQNDVELFDSIINNEIQTSEYCVFDQFWQNRCDLTCDGIVNINDWYLVAFEAEWYYWYETDDIFSCRSFCPYIWYCGDWIQGIYEECDDGELNGGIFEVWPWCSARCMIIWG